MSSLVIGIIVIVLYLLAWSVIFAGIAWVIVALLNVLGAGIVFTFWQYAAAGFLISLISNMLKRK